MIMHLIYWKHGTLSCRNRVKWSNSPRFNYLHTGWSISYRLQLNLHSWRRSGSSSIYKCLPYIGEIWGQHRPRFSSLCALRNCISTNGDLWMWTIIFVANLSRNTSNVISRQNAYDMYMIYIYPPSETVRPKKSLKRDGLCAQQYHFNTNID